MHPFSVDNYTKLKTKEYYVDSQDFPTTGDFVMINYISSGDSQIIDTPGMRELGMWDVSEGLCDAFADVEQFLGKCRFSDCRHEREPGCAIKAAIDTGELDIARWESYQKLKEEAVDKAEMLRRKNEWHKGLAKFTRQRNKEIW